MGRDAQMKGVEGHREDHGPDREREEGGQDALAEHRHGEEKRGTDENLEQAAREASFEVRVGWEERRHDGSLVLGFCRFASRVARVRQQTLRRRRSLGAADRQRRSAADHSGGMAAPSRLSAKGHSGERLNNNSFGTSRRGSSQT
jgi:hypothetical protein